MLVMRLLLQALLIFLSWAGAGPVGATAGGPSDRAGSSETPSTKSAPPDTTPYTRPVMPDEYRPAGVPALPPDLIPPPRPETSSPDSPAQSGERRKGGDGESK